MWHKWEKELEQEHLKLEPVMRLGFRIVITDGTEKRQGRTYGSPGTQVRVGACLHKSCANSLRDMPAIIQ